MYCKFEENKVTKIEKDLPRNLIGLDEQQLANNKWYPFIIDSSESSDFNKFVGITDSLTNFIVTRKYNYVNKTLDEVKPHILSLTKEKLFTKLNNKHDIQEQIIILSGVVGNEPRQSLLNDYTVLYDLYKSLKSQVELASTINELKVLLNNEFFN
jgi:hypothetical protein